MKSAVILFQDLFPINYRAKKIIASSVRSVTAPKSRRESSKHKPTNVGRIALELKAGRKTLTNIEKQNPAGSQTTDLPINNQMH